MKFGLLERFRRRMQVETGAPRDLLERKGDVQQLTFQKKVPHPANLSDFMKYYKNDDQVHSAVNSLANMSVGEGYWTECENENAKKIVDDFAEAVGLDQFLLKIVKKKLIYGFCPVERWFVKGPPVGNLKLKLLPPQTVYFLRTKKGKHLGYKQQFSGSQGVDFKVNEIVWFTYGLGPYGCSLVGSVLPLLKAKAQTNKDMPKVIHRYGSPLTVWQTKGDVTNLKDAVTDREPNEDIFLGHVDEGDTRFSTVEMDPRGRFDNYIDKIIIGILEGLQAPSLQWFRNATEASATKLMEIVERHVSGIQRYMKRVVEREIFTVLLARHGISDIPTINWGVPKTGLEDLDLGGLAELVSSGALTPLQAQNLMIQMGLPLEEVEEEPLVPEPEKKLA